MDEPQRKRKAPDDDQLVSEDDSQRTDSKGFLTRPPLMPYISITTEQGRRVYVELEEIETTVPKMDNSRASLLPSFGKTYDAVLRSRHDDLVAPTPLHERKALLDNQLWVSKYAPRCFTDLISDERVNRQVLEWVKTWDEVVFGSTEFKTRMAAAAKATQERLQARRGGRGGGRGGAASSSNTTSQEKGNARAAFVSAGGSKGSVPSTDRRPEKRILLLHGPPGAGKTTLAHIIAVQAGYRVVEINASDDRSAASMYAKVLPALEMESVDQGKPNCVVLDEIDGTVGAEGQSAVDCIVAIATFKADASKADLKDDDGDDDDDEERGAEKSGSKGKSAPSTLQKKKGGKRDKGRRKHGDGPSRAQSRPVICICNELYTPSLIKLREIAQVIRVDKPDVQRLVARLRRICEDEQFTAESKALTALAELTERDIRASLNCLQFLRRRSSHLRVETLTDGIVGEKDQELGIFKVWEELFKTPVKNNDILSEAYNQKRLAALHKREVLGESIGVEELDDSIAFKSRHYGRLYDLLQYHSDRDRIIAGAWANLFAPRIHDPHLTKMAHCINWFEYIDMLLRKVRSEQSQPLARYIPAGLVGMSLVLAGDYAPQFTYPREESELFARQTRNRAVAAQLKAKAGSDVDIDVLAPLLTVIHPTIRTNNITVLQPAEKEALMYAAQVMHHYGLSFAPTTGDEGGIRLDPPIDSLARIGTHHIETLTNTQKEFVQHEINRIKMMAEAQQQSRASVPRLALPEVPTMIRDQKRADLRAKAMAASQQLATRTDIVRDFFGRPVVPKLAQKRKEDDSNSNAAPETAAAAALPRLKPPVTYKFKEGYTNAVRRKVFMRDFL